MLRLLKGPLKSNSLKYTVQWSALRHGVFFEKQRQLSLKSLLKKKLLPCFGAAAALWGKGLPYRSLRVGWTRIKNKSEARNLKPSLPFFFFCFIFVNLCFCYLNRRRENLANSSYCASVLRVYFISFMVFCLRRWAAWLCFSTGCFVLLSVACQHPAGLGKCSRKTVTASCRVYQDTIVFYFVKSYVRMCIINFRWRCYFNKNISNILCMI